MPDVTQLFGVVFGMTLAIIFYGFMLWVIYKFYRAMARIGDELSQIKEILRSGPPR